MQHVETVREAILLAFLVVIAYTDVAHGKAYDWCTLPAMGLGLLVATILGGVNRGSFNLVQSLLGLFLGGGVFGLLYLYGGFSAGDVKIAAAIGALKGWWFVFQAIIYSALVGLVMAVGLLIWKGQFWRGLRDTVAAHLRLGRPEKTLKPDSPARLTVPYGLAMSIGTLWIWFRLYVL